MKIKIAVTSDMHLRHWFHRTRLLNDLMPHELAAKSIAEERPDVIIDAGDLERNDLFDEALKKYGVFDIPCIQNIGNHEFYGKYWHGDPTRDFKVGALKGFRFAATTLWSSLNNNDPLTAVAVRQYLADFTRIAAFNTDLYYEAHVAQLGMLNRAISDSHVDVIVTHHAPSWQSVHPRYRGSPVAEARNFGFASHLDDIVRGSDASLWIHGHVHDPFDYKIGGTRVVCNPCGYPGERSGSYKPLYVEVEK